MIHLVERLSKLELIFANENKELNRKFSTKIAADEILTRGPSYQTLQYLGIGLTFPKRQILDSSKLKGFADDNFMFHENGRMFSTTVENTVGRNSRKHSLRAISPFPTVFSKDLKCKHVKTRACLGKENIRPQRRTKIGSHEF